MYSIICSYFCYTDAYSQPKGQGPVRLTQSTADDYVIDLLAQCEQKLMKLMEDLDGKDVSELYSGMEDEEVWLLFVTLSSNLRIFVVIVQANILKI